MLKKYLIILTLLFIFIFIFIVFSSTTFAQKYYLDVVSTKYYEPVEILAEFEILSEYDDSYFHPEKTIDRATFDDRDLIILDLDGNNTVDIIDVRLLLQEYINQK